jgi:beta-glucanase (GH16 family)
MPLRTASLPCLYAAGALLMGTTLAPPAVGAPLEVPAGYRLVWADEFDADGLPDPAKWVHDTVRNKEGWHNNELQYYAAPRAQNAVVKNGRLVITARKESLSDAPDWGGQRYTSARLITRGKADWTYGFFEVRAKMPCGRGTWPAIWTLGSGGRWPDDGELDIMEHVGSDPARVSSAVHVRAAHGANPVYGAARLPDACNAFHDYQMHWTRDGVSFGVDGFVHLHYPRQDVGPRAWPFDAPQYLLLNVAIGGHLGGPVDDRIFPVQMEVEHVRVYQPPPPGTAPGR